LLSINFNLMTPADMELLEALYDGEVASVDSELRSLFGELEREGILDHAVVVVTADHGEEFKEHGRYSHGYALFEESVRVPLILIGPGIEKGRVVERNVSLLDLAPTLLELAGLPPEPVFEGRSLVPPARRASLLSRFFSTDEGARDVILELPPTGSKWDLRAHARGIVRASTKLLIAVSGPRKKAESTQIYDLASDPGEVDPNPGVLDGELPALLAALRERTQELATRAAGSAEKGVIDEATKEKLRALGYQL
jgi:arylsulfatase A-like enzyme